MKFTADTASADSLRHQADMSRVSFHGLPELVGVAAEPVLESEGEAALRQLTLQRLMAYGVEYGDAARLRVAVQAGVRWKDACLAIAEAVLAASPEPPPSRASRCGRMFRASALLRMAQMMMLADSEERRILYRRAATLFEKAGREMSGLVRTLVPCRGTHLVGWHLPASHGTGNQTVVAVGGIEGWAMDLAPQAASLAERGLSVFLLDGPGQGESRFDHGAYLTAHWTDDLSAVLDHLHDRFDVRAFGLLGNSMGGNFAIHYAAADARIAACCSNGTVRVPLSQRSRTNFFPKMQAFFDPPSDGVWASLEITPASVTSRAPFLIVHGELDPLVAVDDSRQILEWSQSDDKQMHVFAKGDHCVYDKPSDRADLISDWFASRLPQADHVNVESGAKHR